MTPRGGRPLRILHVLDTFENGGAQRVALSLGLWSSKHDCRPGFWGADGPLAAGLTAPTFVVPQHRSSFVRELLSLDAAVRAFSPDLLHAHQRRQALLAHLVGTVRRVPVVEHAHTDLPTRDHRFLSYRSRRVFAVSDSIRTMVVTDFHRPASRVVATGNAPAHLSTESSAAADFAAEPLRILGIGRLTEQKDPERFISAVEHLAARRRVVGRWVGDGPLEERLRERVRAAGIVELAGASADIVGELDRAHLLLSTSKWEGTPLVLLEAMARGRPVVATAVGGVPALLGDGRGVTFSPDASGSEIGDLLDEVLADPEALLDSAARAERWVEDSASQDVVFAPILTAYRLIGRRR
ncbi:glycosyltransferase [Rathayibacter sp. SD072]|uniref:glycosyltransferase n=1 Tax=Rathayibacter sp. SD072 TaxID=2781731 RepID=UPI001A973F6F|nr:glycosyltransferase [Rathayibacter sp. SD072]MBO0982870.1 glycosyltransferase [Rathayibacter sp. SD072]